MNILFVTSTRIGDAILSTGLLEYLRAKENAIDVTIACGPSAAPLFYEFPNLKQIIVLDKMLLSCLLYTSPSPRDATLSRMPSSA